MEKPTTELIAKEKNEIAAQLNAEIIRRKEPQVPPNKDTRFSLQVIAFNEIDSTEGPLTRLPNLVTHLISVVSACDSLLSANRKERVEVLVNVNNKPGTIPLGNLRSLNFLRLAQSTTLPTLENLSHELDWLPTYEEALKDKRKMLLLTAHYKLLKNIQRLQAHGFQFHMVDCTDGTALVDKNKNPQFTQGARRAILSEIAYKRLKSLEEPDRDVLMFPLDADTMIKPATFVTLAQKIEELDTNRPLLFRESVKVISDKSEFIGSLSNIIDGNSILKTIESFSSNQLDFLQKIVTNTELFVSNPKDITNMQRQELIEYRNELFLQLNLTSLLIQNGFTENQILFLTSITKEKLKQFLGEDVQGSDRSHFFQKIKLIKMLLSSKDFAENLNTSLTVTRILEALSLISGKSSTIVLPAFIGSYLFNAKAYEKSPWDYEIDKAEDQAILDKLYKSAHVVQLSEQLVTIRDRIRVESWVGSSKKRANSTYEGSGKTLLARQTQTWLKNNGFSEMAINLDNADDLLETLLNMVIELLNKMSSTFSEQTLRKLQKLNELHKHNHKSVFAASVVEFISTIASDTTK